MKYLVFAITVLALLFTIRGRSIDLADSQTHRDTSPGGPYEGSNSAGRFAVTEAIVKTHSFFLTFDQAKFAAPDVAKLHGKYISIFTPGVSFLGIPLYVLGGLIGFPQQGAYFTITLIALVNFILIAKLAHKLTASLSTAILSGFIFLFATNALPYANTFTQHHVALSIVLLSLILALRSASFFRDVLIGLLAGLGLLVDLPTALMLLPVGLYVLSKHVSIESSVNKFHLSIKYSLLGLILGALPMVGIFAWYNYHTTGSASIIAQSIGRAPELDVKPIVAEDTTSKESHSALPYKTRSVLNGLYILIISNERGWFYYSPILIAGVLGLILSLKSSHRDLAKVSLGIILMIIASYSMFGDPWGGWSYGARYMIPASGVVSIFIGLAVKRFHKQLVFMTLFIIAAIYSIYVASLGALTTNAVPPKVESVNLSVPIPYTYRYNQKYFIDRNISSSLAFNTVLKDYLTAHAFLISLTAVLSVVMLNLYFWDLYPYVRKLYRH